MRIVSCLPLVLLSLSCATAKPKGDADAPIASTAAQGEAGDTPVDDSPMLPRDPDVRTGKLDNGLTYYIRHHEKPEKRALLWLAVDAGSVLEDDDQRGLAHFVEHMAFNGTKRFAKNTIIDFLEKAGMDFGADLNAFTSFDETVYQLKVPTDDPKMVPQGLDILEEWASALLFDPTEVDKERGVVIEEWRLGRGAGQRVFDKQLPIWLEGSKYALRKPIGEKDILQNAPVAALRRYYDDWYRPDLMAVVVVGDVDVDAMEKDLRKRFGRLHKPAKPRPRPEVPVPLLDKTRAAVIPDPELPSTSVTMSIKGPLRKLRTENDYRAQLTENLFHGMLRARLDEIRQDPKSPFVFAFSNTSSMGRAVDIFTLTAGAKAGRIEDALRSLVVEVERVERHGFLASELERERARMLRNAERAVMEKDTVDSRGYAFETVRRHLDKKAMPGREAELALTKKILPYILIEDVNALAAAWTSRKDRVVIASGPARDQLPSDKDLLAVVGSVEKLEIAAYEDRGEGEKLMVTEPKPGTVKSEETIAEVDTTVWTLSNGARVVVRPTDFKKDEVMLEAFSPGGHSLLPVARWKSARFADDIASRSGVAEHDAVELKNMLAGKIASVRPFVGELEEGLFGSASPADLELMLQLVHLQFTAAREDEAAFAAWKAGTLEAVKNRDLNPQTVLSDRLLEFSFRNHERRRPLTTAAVEAADHKTALAAFRERFADAGDFTFVLGGNVDLAALKPLVEKYLASLPSKGRKEKWKDVGAKKPGGVKRLEVAKGQDPKSWVSLDFHGSVRWTPEAEADLDILADVLDIRLREVMREDMSGVYGVQSNGSITRRPRPLYDYRVNFSCAPENADKLEKAVYDVIATVKKDGVAAEYLDKVREIRRRKLETQLKENRFWMRQLAEHFRFGTDPRKILELEKSLERITAANVQKSAKTYLDPKRVITGRLMPEAGAPK
jgi:zinc protease